MMKKPLIGFISSFSPSDKKASSGTIYSITQQLERIGTLVWIPAIVPPYYRGIELFIKFLSRLCGKNISFGYTKLGAMLLAANIKTEFFNQCDILIAFFTGSKLGYVDLKNKPLIYLSDATFPAMLDYYPPFCKLWKWNIKQGIELEKKMLERANAVVLSSDWSAASAIKDLGLSANKIHVIEFGANIDEKDILNRNFQYANHIDLLFLGVEWARKGGDVAVEATRWLNENGIPATLHVVGIKKLNESIKSLSYVDYVGFLDKNNPIEYSCLVQKIKSCHAMLLPTIAECSAISFAESNAYGLPVYTYCTGGVSNYIQNGKNGYMLPLGSSGIEFGKKIKENIESGELEHMACTAPQVYKEKLNWNTWLEQMNGVVSGLLRIEG